MNVTRLYPSDDFDWALWPQVRRRMRDLGEQIGGMNVNNFVRDIEVRWVRFPEWLGIWAFFNDGELAGHAVCTVETVYGEPIIYCHQLSVDQPSSLTLRHFCFTELYRWIEELNRIYKANGDPMQINRRIRFYTVRVKGTIALLKEMKPEHVFNVIDIQLDDQPIGSFLESKGENNGGQ